MQSNIRHREAQSSSMFLSRVAKSVFGSAMPGLVSRRRIRSDCLRRFIGRAISARLLVRDLASLLSRAASMPSAGRLLGIVRKVGVQPLLLAFRLSHNNRMGKARRHDTGDYVSAQPVPLLPLKARTASKSCAQEWVERGGS